MSDRKKEFNIGMKSHMTELFAPAIIMLVDYVMVMLSELAAYIVRSKFIQTEGVFFLDSVYVYAIIPLVYLVFLHGNSDSIVGRPFWQTARRTFWNIIYSIVAIAVIIYLQHIGDNTISRIFLIGTGIFSVIFIITGRYFLRKEMGKHALFQIPVLFIGAGKTAEKLIFSMNSDVGFGYRIIGFIDDNPASKLIANQFRILGGFAQAERIVRRLRVRYVFITAPGLSQEQQIKLVNSIQPYVKSVSFVPNFWGAPGNLEIVSLSDAGLMLIRAKNNLANWHNKLIKRIFDLVCVFIGLPFVVPILIGVAVAIYKDDGFPIFYSKPRLGYNNKEFICFKFRSMYKNGDEILEKYLAENPKAKAEWDEFAKLRDYDPRVTPVGRVIRRLSLDELPQLLNVIIGNMSLVGPRPYLPREREQIGSELPTILATVPGITGLWQTSGRNEVNFDERVVMDSWYVHNWSVWMDIWYLIKTFKVVFLRKGAY